MTPTLQFLVFITGFIIILLLFIRLIQLAEKRWGGRIARQRQARIEQVTIAGIILGIAMMFQPWTVALFEPGFLLLLFSTLAFILWSHVLPRPAPAEAKASEEVH
jgi:phage shock protein PspC (stress-responsive transcriptional regulator)